MNKKKNTETNGCGKVVNVVYLIEKKKKQNKL